MRLLRDPTLYAAIFAALLPFLSAGSWASATSKEYVVSQLGLVFTPGGTHDQAGRNGANP